MKLNPENIDKISQLMEENQIKKFKFSSLEGALTLQIKEKKNKNFDYLNPNGNIATQILQNQNANQPLTALVSVTDASLHNIKIDDQKQLENQNIKSILSPMMGTFYSAPSPESPNYASVGEIVKKGDVLCIVEAMKLMNEIKSEINGKVIKSFFENGSSVKKDQELFQIKEL